MSCAEAQADFSLYLYGELDFAREEHLELHLEGCPVCQLALKREKDWHAAVNRQQMDVRPELLAACRNELQREVKAISSGGIRFHEAAADWLKRVLDLRVTDRSFHLATVSFLLLAGFAVGRAVNFLPGNLFKTGDLSAAGFIRSPVTRVAAIRPESGNRVRIVLQQIEIKEVSGSRDDDGVRAILVDGLRQAADPGIRLDSVEMLAGQTGNEIRNALINTIRSDPNSAVRIRAIQSLGQFGGDARSRGALEFALANDRDPEVRAVAMDALVPAQGDFQVTPQLLQTLSQIMHDDAQNNDYVRLRCAQILNEHDLVEKNH